MRKPAAGSLSKRASPKEKARHTPQIHQRINARLDFEQLFRCGKRWGGRYVNVWIYQPEAVPAQAVKVAIMVGRKAEASAVKRNRWKRRIRVIFSRRAAEIRPGTKILFQVRKCGVAPEFLDLERDISQLLKQAGIVDDSGK